MLQTPLTVFTDALEDSQAVRSNNTALVSAVRVGKRPLIGLYAADKCYKNPEKSIGGAQQHNSHVILI